MFAAKFIYDLTGHPKPEIDELDEEVDRLLFIKGIEEADYLVPADKRDQLSTIDSEVLISWIKRRIEPTLVALLLVHENNYQKSKSELVKMERYNTMIDRLLRTQFVAKRAVDRVKRLCTDEADKKELKQLVERLKKTLTFLSHHLSEENNPNCTLQKTEAYMPSDVILYNYLKRILVGNYKDFGLKAHIRLCAPLIQFMSRYASKNRFVTDLTREDPLGDTQEENNLATDIARPAIIAIGLILFCLWRNNALAN